MKELVFLLFGALLAGAFGAMAGYLLQHARSWTERLVAGTGLFFAGLGLIHLYFAIPELLL